MTMFMWPDVGAMSQAPGTGLWTATFASRGTPRWLERVTVVCSVYVPVSLYVGGVIDTHLAATSLNGRRNVFDAENPIYIAAGTQFFVVWDNSDPNVVCSASAQWREV